MNLEIQSMRSSVCSEYSIPDVNTILQYHKNLVDFPEIMDYLKIIRNLTEETINKFCIGYDYYKEVISIPEMKDGRFSNIAYMSMNQKSKVKYYKEKNMENWIFNMQALELAKKNQSILICSNQFDAMSAWQAGFQAVVSVPVGKDAVGAWMELFDSIPRVYLSFEANKQMKRFGIDFADRLGTDKCFEVLLPEGINDLNSYFKKYDSTSFKEVLKNAKPYYKYTYKGLSDVIANLRERVGDFLEIKCLPFIKWKDGFTAVMSGVTNIGKTTVALNVANELVNKNIPVLLLVIERSIEDSGERFLQIRFSKTQDTIKQIDENGWDEIINDVKDLPLYFANTNIKNLESIIVKSKKLFNTKFVIIDHLDKLIRNSNSSNYIVEQAFAIGEIVKVCQDNNIMSLVLHHIKKQEGVGAVPKKPSLNDLKGSGSIKDDPEAVIMLSEPDNGFLEVDILKNKGPMGSRVFKFSKATGVIGEDVTESPNLMSPQASADLGYKKF